LGTIDTGALGVYDTEGITIDPATGNILVVDDLGDGDGELFEITLAGALISTVDLSTISGLSTQDGLALSVDRATGRLFVGQGWDNRVDIFQLVVREQGEIPEPSTVIVWSLLAALGIGVGSCRRKRKR